MAKEKLQTYDISYYETQAQYDKKLSKLDEQLKKFETVHNDVSKKAHTQFLENERVFEDKLKGIKEASSKDSKVVSDRNKAEIAKIKTDKKSAVDSHEDIVSKLRLEADQAQVEFKESIKTFNAEEQTELDQIKEKYIQHIASYKEKLDIYNTNFNNNASNYQAEIDKFITKIDEYKNKIEAFDKSITKQVSKIVNDNKTSLIKSKELIDQETKNELGLLSEAKDKNTEIAQAADKAIESIITEYKDAITNHYDLKVDTLKSFVDEQKAGLHNIQLNIDKEFEATEKVMKSEKEKHVEEGDSTLAKTVDKKLALYKKRTAAAKSYEAMLHSHLKDFYTEELEYFKLTRHNETVNVKKLGVILSSDVNELNANIDYMNGANETLINHLKSSEKAHFEQLFFHEEVRHQYALKQLEVFDKLKSELISLTNEHLTEISEMYKEIDSLNQYLDTAEPLKEIEINALREELEVKELNQRIAFKVGKQTHDIDLIENKFNYDKKLADLNLQRSLADFQKQVSLNKLDKERDEEDIAVKTKFLIAEQEYNIRIQNRLLERDVLKSEFDSQKEAFDIKREMAKLNVYRKYDLEGKELEYQIKLIENQKKYQVEVIKRSVDDELLKLEEQLTRIRNDITKFKVDTDTYIQQKRQSITEEKESVEADYQNKLEQVDLALKRELNVPQARLFESKGLIDSRIDNFNTYNIQYLEFMEHLVEALKFGEDPVKSKEKAMNNTSFEDYTLKYLTNIYAILEVAIKFMFEVNSRRLDNQIANTVDAVETRKLQRNKTKLIQKNTTQLERLNRDLKDREIVVKAMIKQEKATLNKSSITTLPMFEEKITNFYNKVFYRLRGVQEQLQKEATELYSPLIAGDEFIIEYAEKSAQTAKEKIKVEMADKIKPLDDALNKIVLELQEKEQKELLPLENKKNELEAQVKEIKTLLIQHTKEIESKANAEASVLKSQLKQIEETTEAGVVRAYEALDRELSDLEENYRQQVAILDQKDEEAKHILDFEEKIKTMTLEASVFKYKDAYEKAKNAYQGTLQGIDKSEIHIKNELNEADKTVDQTLKKLFKEQDSFANKNSIKDDIQSATQDLNIKLSKKKLEKERLMLKVQDLISTAETRMFTSIEQAKQVLTLNLEKYVVDCENNDFDALNDKDRQIMDAHFTTVREAIHQLKQDKHKATLAALVATNEKIFGEEE